MLPVPNLCCAPVEVANNNYFTPLYSKGQQSALLVCVQMLRSPHLHSKQTSHAPQWPALSTRAGQGYIMLIVRRLELYRYVALLTCSLSANGCLFVVRRDTAVAGALLPYNHFCVRCVTTSMAFVAMHSSDFLCPSNGACGGPWSK